MKIGRFEIGKMLWAGITAGLLFWFLEAGIHIVVFKEGVSYFHQVFFADAHEVWMRAIVAVLFVAFGVYAQHVVERRRRAEEEFQRQSQFLRSVIESLTYPFYVVNADSYEVEIANIAARQGRSLDESLHCYSLTHKSSSPCQGADHVCPLKIVKETKQPSVTEHVHYDRNGNLINVEVHGYPIFDDKGNVARMIEYALDITARKQAETALKESETELREALGKLEKAYKELQEVDNMKSDFISTASHELKTPLTSIKSASSILLKDANENMASEQDKELLRIILRNVDRQARTVNNLLDLSRIEAGVLRMDIENFDIIGLTREVFASFEFQIREKSVTYSLDSPEESLYVAADSEQIRRALGNVIGNAVKFTLDNSNISVKVKKERNQIKLAVTDAGPGIPKDRLEKIFDKFYRADDGRLHMKSGTGLGLAIAKGIVKAHGGRIWAESEIGKGSSFYFVLPVSSGKQGVVYE